MFLLQGFLYFWIQQFYQKKTNVFLLDQNIFFYSNKSFEYRFQQI